MFVDLRHQGHQKTIDQILTHIANGPVYVCTICNRSLYKVSVTLLQKDGYNDQEVFNLCYNASQSPSKEFVSLVIII